MNCRAAERYIFAERDGALEETQRAELAAHIATCAACRAVRDGLTSAAASWRDDAARVSVPDTELEWQKVRRQIRGAPTTSKRSKLTWIGLPLAGAAAAAAIGIYLGTAPSAPTPAAKINAAAVQSAPAVAAAENPPPSTVVYVDEKSGWTFVVAADDSGQHI